MENKKNLSDVWLKASVLGATWAASEIILGSFLHNLHIPFKGNILTAIGLILLISASYKWDDKGLFWRSGLICALMKTMSPSAVIFGPMVAILAEALLLEVSVRVFGRNLLGFLIGSALAMSWILGQKIINFIIFYGFNIVEIYGDVLKFAEKQLNIQFDIFWLPILILLGLYILFGLISALVGMKIGKELLNNNEIEIYEAKQTKVDINNNQKRSFPYSISWLLFDFIGLISALILITKSAIYIWIPVTTILITVWVLRYKRAMRQLSKPKFWISFVVITVLSAMLITSFNGGENRWLDGLLVGIQMNFRAAIVIVGFTVLGTELYNPKIRNYLSNSVFKQVPTALELAFESLPFVVSQLPDARTFFTKPAGVIKLLISHAEERFNSLKNKQQANVFIVSGDISEGKTRFLSGLAKNLQMKNFSVGGFYTPRILENDQTIGYSMVSVESGEQFNFLKLKNDKTAKSIGRYEINFEGIQQGKHILNPEYIKEKDFVIIDEVGKLELNGNGWNNNLKQLLVLPDLYLIIAVRTEFVPAVIEKFNISNVTILPLSTTTIDQLTAKILKTLNK